MYKKYLAILLLTVVSGFACAGKIVYPEILPQAIIHPGSVSQSPWLWDSDQPVKNKAFSSCRLSFGLSEEIAVRKKYFRRVFYSVHGIFRTFLPSDIENKKKFAKVFL